MPAGLLKMTPVMCLMITEYARHSAVVGYEQSTREAIDILEIASGCVIMLGNNNKCLRSGHLVKL